MAKINYTRSGAIEVQITLSNQLNELPKKLLNIYELSKNFSIKEAESKHFVTDARFKISKAKESIESISLSKPDSLNYKIAQAKVATNEAINSVESFRIFVLGIERVATEGKAENNKKLQAELDNILKEKRNDSADEWIHILHLSDLHFGAKSLSGTPDQDAAKHLKIVETELLKILNDQSIDVIVITGDISYKGEVSGYKLFIPWLKRVYESLGLKIEDVIICPGNHDSQWIKRSEHDIKAAKSPIRPDDPIDKCSVNYILSRDNVRDRLEQFQHFTDACIESGIGELVNNTLIRTSPGNYLFGRRKHKGVNFVVLNSAWNHFPVKDDNNGYNHGNLFLGHDLVGNIDPQSLEDDPDIVVTLFHHPLSWLNESEQRTYDDSGDIPVVKSIKMFSDIILNGHVHGEIQPPDTLANKTLAFCGGSLHTIDSPIFEFEIISINKTKRYCRQTVFTWKKDSAVASYPRWYKTASSGYCYFGADKYARELFAMVEIGELSIEEAQSEISTIAQESIKDEVKKTFDAIYKTSKIYKIQQIIIQNQEQAVSREPQPDKENELDKIKSKEREKP